MRWWKGWGGAPVSAVLGRHVSWRAVLEEEPRAFDVPLLRGLEQRPHHPVAAVVQDARAAALDMLQVLLESEHVVVAHSIEDARVGLEQMQGAVLMQQQWGRQMLRRQTRKATRHGSGVEGVELCGTHVNHFFDEVCIDNDLCTIRLFLLPDLGWHYIVATQQVRDARWYTCHSSRTPSHRRALHFLSVVRTPRVHATFSVACPMLQPRSC